MQITKEVGIPRMIRYTVFSLWQVAFDLLPFSPLRVWWLQIGGAQVSKNTVIDKIDFINLDRTGLKGLKIGQRCFLGRGAQLDLAGKITIEDWVTISPRVIILSHMTVGFKNHTLLKRYPSTVSHTRIHSSSFIGAGTIVLGGVKISHNSLIGAGAVVTKNIPKQSVAYGNPARVKKLLRI